MKIDFMRAGGDLSTGWRRSGRAAGRLAVTVGCSAGGTSVSSIPEHGSLGCRLPQNLSGVQGGFLISSEAEYCRLCSGY